MRSFRTLVLASLILSAGFWCAQAAPDVKARARRSKAVLYRIRSDASPAEMEKFQAVVRKHKIVEKRKLIQGRVRLADAAAPQGLTEEALAEAIMATGAVEFAEPDYLNEPTLIPNDPGYGSQWFHNRIGSASAWNSCTGSSSIIVAICDSGVESGHPDLAANMKLPGYNSVDGSSSTEPVHSHGTRTAGCVGAVGNNGIGAAGVCWNIKIMPIRITNRSDGWAYTSDMSEGIRWAADHGARVANLSYSGAGSATIDSAAKYMRTKNGLLFMSAGNDGADQTSYPDFTSFVSVGSVNSSDSRSSFSNYGTFVDIVAPGESIYAPTTGGSYSSSSGTSFSSPIAAGLCALLFSAKPSLTPSQVEQVIFSTCKDLGTAGDDNVYGRGRIDAAAAMAAVLPSTTNQPPIADATANPETGNAPLAISFSGSASRDSDGSIVAYNWNFDDGATASGANVSHTFTVAGSYVVTLSVTDDDGATGTDSVVIVVDEPPVRDVAITDVSAPASATKGTSVTVNVTAKNLGNVAETFSVVLDESPDGTIIGQQQVTSLAAGASKVLAFQWNTSSATACSHTLYADATVVVSETSTSNNSGSAVITITEPTTPPPTSNGTGLTGEYFHDMALSQAAITRTDDAVDFFWARGTSPDSSIQEDTFSARWSGEVQALYSEDYTFYTLSDDGVKLWVGGRLLVDNWASHSPTENTGVIALEAGVKYDIVMEYYENGYDATAKLYWSSASQAKQIVPQACLFPAVVTTPPPTPTGNGLSGQYFNNIDLTSPVLTRTDATVNFSWLRGTSPDGAIGEDSFSVRWTGQVEALRTETHTFYTLSDDGVRLWVNGTKLVDNWTNHSPTENSGSIALVAGQRYNITMEYFESSGDATARLYWSSPSMSKQIIPSDCLFPTTGTTPPPDPDPEPEPTPDGTGLRGEYYNGMDFASLLLTRTDAKVDFSWLRGTSPAPSVPTDKFSVRWSGEIEAQFSETYTFYTLSDDGIRLFVKGQKVIDNWTDHSATENSGTIALTAGQRVPIVVEYYEKTGDAAARLSWASPSQPKQVVPQVRLYPSTGGAEPLPNGDGLLGTFFNNMDLTSLVTTRTDATVNFTWLRGAAPATGVGEDTFSVRWTGKVQPLYSQTYTFYTVSDDGVRLWVNGTKLVDNWTNHSTTENSGTITLEAGVQYSIVMEFYDNAYDATAQLKWSSASQAKEIIPTSCLFSR